MEDITSAFRDSAVKVDLGVAGEVLGDVRTNVVILREKPKGDPTLAEITADFRKQATANADGKIEPTRQLELDGHPAASWTYDSKGRGTAPIGRQQQVTTLRKGSIYTLTFTSNRPGFEGQRQALTQLLESWRWTD